MITGRVLVDLSVEPDLRNESRDRRLLYRLENCPDGAEVVVDIGDRRYVTEDAAYWLHQNDHRLHIVIQGTNADAVRQFVHAAREGAWSVVA